MTSQNPKSLQTMTLTQSLPFYGSRCSLQPLCPGTWHRLSGRSADCQTQKPHETPRFTV